MKPEIIYLTEVDEEDSTILTNMRVNRNNVSYYYRVKNKEITIIGIGIISFQVKETPEEIDKLMREKF